MAQLGDHVVYRAHSDHHTSTTKDGTEVAGSVHHVSQREFAGLVGRCNPSRVVSDPKTGATTSVPESFDLIIFPPNKPPVWIDGAREGSGDGQFSLKTHPWAMTLEQRVRALEGATAAGASKAAN